MKVNSLTSGILALTLLGASQWALPVWASESATQTIPIRQPAVRSVFPLVGQAGQSVSLELAGDFLDPKGRLRCGCGDVKGIIQAGNALSLTVRIELSASARPGPRIFYLETSRGTSNPFLFRVTHWPSQVEREPNNRIEEAQEISVPSIVEGRVARLTDTDFFRFQAKAGEK